MSAGRHHPPALDIAPSPPADLPRRPYRAAAQVLEAGWVYNYLYRK